MSKLRTPAARRWPPQTVPWGDAHLPPKVRAALRRGLLRRELTFLVGRGRETIQPYSSLNVGIPIPDRAHAEWICTTSDTRTSGRFVVSLDLELPPSRADDKRELVPFTADLVAWESLAGTGGEPYWGPPRFLPAGARLVIHVTNISSTAGAFNAYLIGAFFVR